MFKCCMCKKHFSGNPKRKNAAGDFCDVCNKEIIRRARKSKDSKDHSSGDATCPYCKRKVTDANRVKGKSNKNIHQSCAGKLRWVLSCIRKGDRMFKYVSYREKKYGPDRDAKIKEAKAIEQAQSKQIVNKVAPITFDTAPECLTPEQVQELLQLSRATFFRLVERGELPGAVKIGGSWRVWRDKLRLT